MVNKCEVSLLFKKPAFLAKKTGIIDQHKTCIYAILSVGYSSGKKMGGGGTIQFGRGGADIFCGKGVISWSIFYFGHGILTMRKGYFNLGVSSRCDLFQFGGERGGGKKKKKKKRFQPVTNKHIFVE